MILVKLKHAKVVTRILLRQRISIGHAEPINLTTQEKCTSVVVRSTRKHLAANSICTAHLKITKETMISKAKISQRLSKFVIAVRA
jgi:hypothetical protein